MPAQPVTIIGSYVSPYVRKVLVCLDLKGIDYRIDPIVPFFGNDEFSAISPLRRIPVLIDERVTLADSTVICEYIEERHPSPPLHPSAPEARARARWLEEFADTRIADVFIWRLFNELVIKPHVWREETDESVVSRALGSEIPGILDYLEAEIPRGGGFFFGEMGIADISVAAFFRNAHFARFAIDADRWPNTAAFVARALEHPSFAKLREFESLQLKTPIQHQREALAAAGAPITPSSVGGASPRRGVLNI